MELKSGVKLVGLHPELHLGLVIANEVYASHGVNMVITSVLDGKHSKTSLHYAGYAADLRIKNLGNTDPYDVAKEIKRRLGVDFDVIVESNHIHLEFQPRF